MKKLFFVVCASIAVSAFAEEALVLPEKTFRWTQSLFAGFQPEYSEQNGERVERMAAMGWGVGAEYGVADWLNMQLLWEPGFWGAFKGGTGPFSDAVLAVKAALLGEDAVIGESQVFRLSAALGIKIPFAEILEPSRSGASSGARRREPDNLLWGTALRVYGDFVANDYFYFNAYAEGAFYPPQRTVNAAFASSTVKHYLDLTGEIEPRFAVPLGESGITLTGGAPVRVFYAPFMDAADSSVSDQYCLSAGGHLGVCFTGLLNPVEISLRYQAPILGRNVEPVHRASLIFRIYANN